VNVLVIGHSFAAPAIQRTAQLQRFASTLPGHKPYENRRPIRVEGRFAGLTVVEFLRQRFPYMAIERWCEVIDAGHMLWEGREIVAKDRMVSGGTTLIHVLPETTEPWVNAAIEVLFEDDQVLVLAKPAPMPMHPCGRFSRHTLTYLLENALPDIRPQIVHRLDADTTGAVIFGKTVDATRHLAAAFAKGKARKLYLACVDGGRESPSYLRCEQAIGRRSAVAGTRGVDDEGLASVTHLFRRKFVGERQTLFEVQPENGRTHQIRLHLAQLGHPIVGDHAYAGKMGENAALTGAPLCLHAWILEIPHPDGRMMHIRAPWPKWAKEADPAAQPEPVAPGW
jgi:RluA family pseudouridine synthase